MLLPDSCKGRTLSLLQRSRAEFQPQSLSLFQRVHIPVRISQKQELISKPLPFFPGKIIRPAACGTAIPKTASAGKRLFFLPGIPLRQIDFHLICQHSRSRVNHRPSIFPHHSGQEGLPSHGGIALLWTNRQHNHVPFSPGRLDDISVPHIPDRIILSQMPVRQDGITGIVFIGPPDITASAHRDCMIGPCSTFCMQNIIIAVLFVQMRTLRPNHIPQSAVPYILGFSCQLHPFKIQLLDPDIPISIIPASLSVGPCSDIVAFSVIIKKQAGIDSLCPPDKIRLRPGTFRIPGRNKKIASP